MSLSSIFFFLNLFLSLTVVGALYSLDAIFSHLIFFIFTLRLTQFQCMYMYKYIILARSTTNNFILYIGGVDPKFMCGKYKIGLVIFVHICGSLNYVTKKIKRFLVRLVLGYDGPNDSSYIFTMDQSTTDLMLYIYDVIVEKIDIFGCASFRSQFEQFTILYKYSNVVRFVWVWVSFLFI